MATSFGKVVDEGGPVAVLQGVKRRRKRAKGLKGWDYDLKRPIDVRGCIDAFLDRRRCKASSVSSDGRRLYSYSTIIATWLHDGTLEMNCEKHSVTTSRMQNFLRNAIGSGTKVKCINVPLTKRQLRQQRGQQFLP